MKIYKIRNIFKICFFLNLNHFRKCFLCIRNFKICHFRKWTFFKIFEEKNIKIKQKRNRRREIKKCYSRRRNKKEKETEEKNETKKTAWKEIERERNAYRTVRNACETSWAGPRSTLSTGESYDRTRNKRDIALAASGDQSSSLGRLWGELLILMLALLFMSPGFRMLNPIILLSFHPPLG